MFLDFLDYLTCWMFVETPLCFQFNLQDAVGQCFKVLLHVDKKRVVRRWGIWPSKPFCKYGLQASFSDTLNNKRKNKRANNQPTNQTNKQTSKQTNKATTRTRTRTTNNKLQTTTTNKQHATNNKRQPCRRIGERAIPNAVWSDSASEFHGLWLC